MVQLLKNNGTSLYATCGKLIGCNPSDQWQMCLSGGFYRVRMKCDAEATITISNAAGPDPATFNDCGDEGCQDINQAYPMTLNAGSCSFNFDASDVWYCDAGWSFFQGDWGLAGNLYLTVENGNELYAKSLIVADASASSAETSILFSHFVQTLPTESPCECIDIESLSGTMTKETGSTPCTENGDWQVSYAIT